MSESPAETTPAVPPWNQAERQRALRAWILRSAASVFTAQGFLVYYLKELGSSDRLLGLAIALPSLALAAQFGGAIWTERAPSRRSLCFRLYLAHVLCWLPLLLVGIWAAGAGGRSAFARVNTVVWLFVISALFHLHSPAWDSWFSDAVEDKYKSGFFGKWGLWTGILWAVIGIGSGFLIDTVARGRGSAAFQLMILVVIGSGMLLMLGAAGLYRRLREVPPPAPRLPVRQLLAVALRQHNYMRFMALFAVRMLAVDLYAAFIIAWFKDGLAMTILFLAGLTAVYQGLVAIASPFWSRLVRRFGGKTVLWAGLTFATLHVLLYFFYTPTNYRWLAPLHWGTLGLLMASFDVSVNTLWYALPSRQARSMQFAIAWASFGVTGAIGAALGGWIASVAPPLAIGPWTWSKYHWLLLLSIPLHLPCFFLLKSVVETRRPYSPRVMVAWFLRRGILRRRLW